MDQRPLVLWRRRRRRPPKTCRRSSPALASASTATVSSSVSDFCLSAEKASKSPGTAASVAPTAAPSHSSPSSAPVPDSRPCSSRDSALADIAATLARVRAIGAAQGQRRATQSDQRLVKAQSRCAAAAATSAPHLGPAERAAIGGLLTLSPLLLCTFRNFVLRPAHLQLELQGDAQECAKKHEKNWGTKPYVARHRATCRVI